MRFKDDVSGSPTRFVNDASGSIAITFTLIFAVLMLCVGGSIDYLRWSNARALTGAAIDLQCWPRGGR